MEPCWCTDRLRSAKAHPWVLSIMINHFFPPTAKLCYADWLWCDPVQLQHQVPEGSEGFRCRYLVRFQRVLMQIAGQEVQVQVPGEVPEGFGTDTVPCEVLEGSDADTW